MIKNELTLHIDELNAIVYANHMNPHHALGMHNLENEDRKSIVVRAFLPQAKNAFVVEKKNDIEFFMNKVHDAGFFEIQFQDRIDCFDYKIKVENYEGHIWDFEDPYRFLPTLTDFDLYLLGQDSHSESYNKLGAHVLEVDGVVGTRFAVWAPNANRVSVIGQFNHWDGRRHPMRMLGSSGIWEIFIPGLASGEIYKYEIKTKEGHLLEKADPYAFYSELRPKTASIVFDTSNYQWEDMGWMNKRQNIDPLSQPMSIYEVHLGSWMKVPEENNRFLTYKELACKLTNYVKEMGYTHIEIMGIAEHPFDGSWGYQVTGYFAPTSRYGTPEDFMYFVNHLHKNNIGIILDWVPAHFPKDDHGLARFDGSALYEHQDPREGEHPDWGTLIFNYGRNEVRNFLVSNASYWLDKYHIDGLRVDAVASMLYRDYGKSEGQWVPNCFGGRENLEAVDFLKLLNSVVYEKFPGIYMIAEESTSWGGVSRPVFTGGLGFGFKWNMGWMNDFLRYIEKDSIYRKYHHNDLTFGMVYAFTENFILVLSHDEVVHGKGSMINKMPGDLWQKFANLRVAYGFMFGHPGKKLLFMGNDIAQWDEWNEAKSIDWHLLEFDKHKMLQSYIKKLNHLYKSEPALHEIDFTSEGFEWIECGDAQSSIVSFIRKGKDPKEQLIFICNFTPTPHYEYRLGVNELGTYEEILNSDDSIYGGSGVKNHGSIQAEEIPANYRDYSLKVMVPPLGTVAFKRRIEE